MNETFNYCYYELLRTILKEDDRIELAQLFTELLNQNKYDYEELQTIFNYILSTYAEQNVIIYNIEEYIILK